MFSAERNVYNEKGVCALLAFDRTLVKYFLLSNDVATENIERYIIWNPKKILSINREGIFMCILKLESF